MFKTTAEPFILPLLQRQGCLDGPKLAQAQEALTRGGLPERGLIKAGLATAEEIVAAYASELLLPIFDPDSPAYAADAHLATLIPEKLCIDKALAPIAVCGDAMEVAFAAAEEMRVIDELQFLTGMMIRPVLASLSAIDRWQEQIYRTTRGSSELEGDAGEFGTPDEANDEEAGDENILLLDAPPPPGKEGRVVRMVNQIIEQALRTAASDIHLEPFEDGCKCRLRIDGVLHELPSPSKAAFVMIISRLKILAKMDIAEKRVPQDGAIALKSKDRRIDLRVNTVPTVYGEKMVMRILDKGAIALDLTNLGFNSRQSTDLIESIQMPHGLALVTGPTGSGKSTTLYSCLNLLNQPKTNICTVEDPVEYKFKGMNQVQVKAGIGLTFASALRAFLRQDPDVIMVGEIRDQETAQICLRAALTGHFVLSTIHTNDALSAVTRLMDMGIEPFLLSCTLRVLEAQRLVRKLCPHCKEAYECEPEVAEQHGLIPGEIFYRPKGCLHCRRVGYRGRMGVFEVIRMTPNLVKLIQNRTPLAELRAAARAEGMQTLFDNAMDKVREGLTSLEAALNVTMSEEE